MQALIDRLKQLRAKKGGIDASDLDSLLQEVVGALGSLSEHKEMVQEIAAIAGKFKQAKEGMRAVAGADGKAQIKGANLELDEVIKATEEASNRIMDAAEKIQALGGKDAQIAEAVGQIFEACSFQDITGQRIRKVLSLLAEVEAGIAHLSSLAGISGTASAQPGAARPVQGLTGRAKEEAEGLLNGPQLGKDKTSQDDIDKLFGEA